MTNPKKIKGKIKESVSIKKIGAFTDSKAGKTRTPKAVAGRLIEEVTELGLACGLSPGEILEHIADSLHSQALKISKHKKQTVFPSELTQEFNSLKKSAKKKYDKKEIGEELADVLLLLKYLSFVAKINLYREEKQKWKAFKKKEFRVSKKGLLYTKKAHVERDD